MDTSCTEELSTEAQMENPVLLAGLSEFLNDLEEVDFVDHPLFAQPDAEQRIVRDDPAMEKFGPPKKNAKRKQTKRPVLSTREEYRLFLQFNYGRYRLNEHLSKFRTTFFPEQADEVFRWYDYVQSRKSTLVQMNMGLVCVMAKRTRIANVEYDELISEGNVALMRAVNKFDVSRGYKFSTYACRAIWKSFCRLATKARKHRERFPTEENGVLERLDTLGGPGDRRNREAVDTLAEVLTRNLAELSSIEQTIIRERFAMSSPEGKKTLSEVAGIVGLTDERVRQIQNVALRKLRVVLNRYTRWPGRYQRCRHTLAF